MRINTVVELIRGPYKGKLVLITGGHYMGQYGVYNHWGGYLINEDGTLNRSIAIDGYDNGTVWKEYNGKKYEIETKVKFI